MESFRKQTKYYYLGLVCTAIVSGRPFANNLYSLQIVFGFAAIAFQVMNAYQIYKNKQTFRAGDSDKKGIFGKIMTHYLFRYFIHTMILSGAIFLSFLAIISIMELLLEGEAQFGLILEGMFPIFLLGWQFSYIIFVAKREPDQVVFPVESISRAIELAERLEKYIVEFSKGKRISQSVSGSEVVFIRKNRYLDWVTGNISISANDQEIIVKADKTYVTNVKAKFNKEQLQCF